MDAGALALPLLFALIAVALAFDFLNGMNDAANSIATIVSTRVLRPQYAVAWAAFFNFVAFLVFGLHVAETVGRGIVEADIVNAHVIFGALAGAIVWQIITNRLGIPSSSSHALIGGLVGAGIAKAGISRRGVGAASCKTVAGIFLSPGLGCLLALLLMLLVSWAFVRFTPLRRRQYFPPRAIRLGLAAMRSATAATTRRRPWASSRCCSIRRATSARKFYVPFWVVLACQIGDGGRHAGRRLAHRAHHGLARSRG